MLIIDIFTRIPDNLSPFNCKLSALSTQCCRCQHPLVRSALGWHPINCQPPDLFSCQEQLSASILSAVSTQFFTCQLASFPLSPSIESVLICQDQFFSCHLAGFVGCQLSQYFYLPDIKPKSVTLDYCDATNILFLNLMFQAQN
jgi:hypothetical protein